MIGVVVEDMKVPVPVIGDEAVEVEPSVPAIGVVDDDMPVPVPVTDVAVSDVAV